MVNKDSISEIEEIKEKAEKKVEKVKKTAKKELEEVKIIAEEKVNKTTHLIEILIKSLAEQKNTTPQMIISVISLTINIVCWVFCFYFLFNSK